MSVTYFVSGHLDLTKEEFEEHYVPLLEAALVASSNFVVGDARGTDTMAQDFLRPHTQLVTVYHMFEKPRYNAGFEAKGGYETDELRDSAMTWASDHDIAWVRPGKARSGTAMNLARRVEVELALYHSV